MALGFAPATPIDQLALGLPQAPDPGLAQQFTAALSDLMPRPSASPPQAQPGGQGGGVAQMPSPSWWQIAQGMIWDGLSPSDAALKARQEMLKAQLLQRMPAAMDRLMGVFSPQSGGSPAPGGAPAPGNTDGGGPGGAPSMLPAMPALPGVPGAPVSGLSDPRTQGTLLAAAMLGVPGSATAIDLLKAAQPHVAYDRGQGFDDKTGRPIGLYHPEVSADRQPIYSADGRLIGEQVLPGAVDATGALASATSSAQEAAKAAYDLVDVPLANGSTVKMPRAIALGLLTGQYVHPPGASGVPQGAPGAAPGTAPVGLGVTPTHAELTLADKRAENQAQREMLQPKEQAALSDLDNRAKLTSQIIHQILGDVQDPRTGQWQAGGHSMLGMFTTGLGANLAKIDGTPAHNLEAQIDHIRAMTALDELQKLREESPTGAGLGRVTQQEIDLLAAMRGSVDQGQSSGQLAQNLRRQLGQLDAIRANRHQLYQNTYGNVQQPAPLGQGAPGAARPGPSRSDLIAEARRRGLIH